MTRPTGRPRGRPPLPDDEKLVNVTIRLSPEDAAKLRFLGRKWLLPRLKKVPPPPELEPSP